MNIKKHIINAAMIMKISKYIKPFDFAVIFLGIALSVSFMISSKRGDESARRLLLITPNEKTYLSWRDAEINLKSMTGKNMTVVVKDGRAMVKESDCPDKVCVHAGWISGCGDMAVCLPNGVALMVECVNDDSDLRLQDGAR